MTKTTTKPPVKNSLLSPLMSGQQRREIWEQARGMWKNRKPDPIKELKKIRKGWNRKIS